MTPFAVTSDNVGPATAYLQSVGIWSLWMATGITGPQAWSALIQFANADIATRTSDAAAALPQLVQVQSDWTNANTSSPAFIKNKPTAPPGTVQSDWAQSNPASASYIQHKPSIPAAQIQSDWNQTNSALLDFIRNKPSITGALTSFPSTQSLGIVADGVTDQTTTLNNIFNNAFYKGIIMDFQNGGAVKISGTVNCNGKIIIFRSGSYFTGAGTLNVAQINAGYKQKLFDSTVNLSGCSTSTAYFSVMWYGATGDGSTDDTTALQMSSDMVIANAPSMARDLYMPPGQYKTTTTWMLYRWDGSNYAQFTINVIGDWGMANSNLSGFARIIPTFHDAPKINVQRATSGSIRGISIEGLTTPGISWDTFITSTYGSISSARDSQYSPDAGITIDGISSAGVIPPDGGYPKLNGSGGGTNWYRGASSGGTTSFKITDCYISGHTVDIAYSVNGSTQQCEDCVIQDCAFHYANVAVVYCQSQTDNCRIINCRSWYYVWTIISTQAYGTGNGVPPSIEGYNVAGFINTLFDIVTNKTFSIHNFYAESFFALGQISAGLSGASIQGTFHFNNGSNLQPQYHFTLANVRVHDSGLIYYDGLFNKRLRAGNPANVIFENCFFDLPPYVVKQRSSQINTVKYINCYSNQVEVLGMNNDMFFLDSANVATVLYGKFKVQNGQGLDVSAAGGYSTSPHMEYSYDCETFDRSFGAIASATITPSGSRTASFTSSFTALCKVNDIVIDDVTGNVLGRISSIVSTTITISEIPMNITSAAYTIDVVYYLTANKPLVGDITSGSADITNVSPLFADAFVNAIGAGFRFDHPAFQRGAYIVSYNSGTRVITMSAVSGKTATRQNFVNGDPIITAKCILPPNSATLNSYNKAFAEGTIWTELVTSSSSSPSVPTKWVFNKGGYLSATTLSLGAAYQADFNIEPLLRNNAGTIQYFDTYANAWVNV